MKNKVIICSSADSSFFKFLESMVRSLVRFKNQLSFELGVLDQGLSNDEKNKIETFSEVRWAKPIWHEWVPSHLRKDKYIGLQARMELRDYFPGYKYYLWFDADAWAQTPEFFDAFVSGAEICGASVVEEKGVGFRKTFNDLKWWYGNLLLCYGLKFFVQNIKKKSINIGVSCLNDTAPHWKKWKEEYIHAIQRSGKINMDQHALFAAIYKNHLPVKQLDSRFNWIPHLSKPIWHQEQKLLCIPLKPFKPISIMHLAGPQKTRLYLIKNEFNKNEKPQSLCFNKKNA